MSLIRVLALSTVLLAACGSDAQRGFNGGIVPTFNVYSGKTFKYYDVEDRVNTAEHMVLTIKADYALWDLKRDNSGIPVEKNSAQYLNTEKQIADVAGEYSRARANLEFLDRTRKYIASFRDTHFRIRPITRSSYITLGFGMNRIDGKFFITSVNPKLLAYISKKSGSEEFAKLTMGDEVVAIGGQTPQEAANALLPYTSASSEAARMVWAVGDLTGRSYRFPEKRFVDISFRKKETEKEIRLRMPWLVNFKKRRDERVFFRHNGFYSYNDLKLRWDAKLSKWTSYDLDNEGFKKTGAPKDLLDGTTYHSSAKPDSQVAMRTGYILRKGKAYAVFQLFTFMAEKVYLDGKELDFVTTVRAFVNKIKSQKLDLIYDLRFNGGGYTKFPGKMLALLAPPRTTYPGYSAALRITQYVRALHDPKMAFELDAGEINGIMYTELNEAIEKTIAEGKAHTPAFSYADIHTDEDLGGYEGKIVALISPMCISSCDIMSMLLSNSGRATLIGDHSNGTGAGYSSNDELSSKWKDRNHIFTTNLPNFLFGRPPESAGQYVWEGQAAELNSENRPVMADEPYSWVMKDFTDASESWYDKAVEVLNK